GPARCPMRRRRNKCGGERGRCANFSGGVVMCEYPRHPKTRAVIVRAREIIGDPDRWTPVSAAVDGEGNERHARQAKAVRFSGAGALRRAAMELIADYDSSAFKAADDAYWAVNTRWGRTVRYDNLEFINEKGHQAMLAVFDEVLASKCKCE